MSGLFNPYALTALGKPLQQRQSPELRVEAPHISRAQLDMAQHTFVRFLDHARLSRVPNHTQQGRLADGTPYRIVTASGAPIMQVWPVVQPQVGNPKGEIYGGYLYITNEKQYVVDVITEDGKHTGKWGVRYIDKGIRLVPLVAGNQQNIVIDGPKGSKIPYLYATDRERGYLFSGGIPYLKLPEDNRFRYLQDSISKVVNGTDWNNGRIYALMLSSGSDNDISYEYAEITKDVSIKNIAGDPIPEVIPQLHVIGFYPSKYVYPGSSLPRQFSRNGHQVIQKVEREVESHLSIIDVPDDQHKKILRRKNAGIIYPGDDSYLDVTNTVNKYYDGDEAYKTSERIYILYNVAEYGLEKVKDIAENTSYHPEIVSRAISQPLNDTRWIQSPIGGVGAFSGKTSIPVHYVEKDEVNEVTSWATGGSKGYAVGEEFERTFSASYRMSSEGTTFPGIGDYFDFSGRLIEGSIHTEEEYSYSGSLSKSATYFHDDWYWGGTTRVLAEPGMNSGIYECEQIISSGQSSTSENSIVTEEIYSRSVKLDINGLNIETFKNNTVVKTNDQRSYSRSKGNSSYRTTHTIDVSYTVKKLTLLLVDTHLDLIIYREDNRSHSYTAEYHKGRRPNLSEMVESPPVIVVVHNKKEVRRYIYNSKRADPPYTYMEYSCINGFEWSELGGSRGSPTFRYIYAQYPESIESGYISTNIMYIAEPTAYVGTDDETVTYVKSPSTGTSLINIKAGESVFTIFVDKVSVHDYHDVMESLELGTPKPTGQVI